MGSPALFIPGGNSPYVSEQYRDDLLAQFPQHGRM
ncbi:putative esterase/lipase [Escherichia coli]|uniref:Putative esterase/lipase n=1 Tax=Escherichia coli TaxID=562 RepID=A0A376TIZ7_ECOLX|nr:putative esterase/lipase [Escherichia coli]